MDLPADVNFFRKNTEEHSMKKEILEALPSNLRSAMLGLSPDIWRGMEEIRLRVNQPLMVHVLNRDLLLDGKGEICFDAVKAYKVTKADIEKTFQLIADYSPYALEEEIRNGFITIRGGHRIGISGSIVMHGSSIKTIKDICGLNIRISRQKIGISDPFMEYIISSANGFYNTLIVSPPQCGKTTLLRDIIRNLSNGMKRPNFGGFKVGVVDERSEICGMYQGIPQNDVGMRTDILDACPKAEGIMMLIRSMSPQIIATDEIGKAEDVLAVKEALNAGIKLVATVHGRDMEEICRRPSLRTLMDQDIFERIIILSNIPRVGTVQSILDGKSKTPVLSQFTKGRRCEVVG